MSSSDDEVHEKPEVEGDGDDGSSDEKGKKQTKKNKASSSSDEGEQEENDSDENEKAGVKQKFAKLLSRLKKKKKKDRKKATDGDDTENEADLDEEVIACQEADKKASCCKVMLSPFWKYIDLWLMLFLLTAQLAVSTTLLVMSVVAVAVLNDYPTALGGGGSATLIISAAGILSFMVVICSCHGMLAFSRLRSVYAIGPNIRWMVYVYEKWSLALCLLLTTMAPVLLLTLSMALPSTILYNLHWMSRQYAVAHNSTLPYRQELNSIQMHFRCCGASNRTNTSAVGDGIIEMWLTSAQSHYDYRSNGVPWSCCNLTTSGACYRDAAVDDDMTRLKPGHSDGLNMDDCVGRLVAWIMWFVVLPQTVGSLLLALMLLLSVVATRLFETSMPGAAPTLAQTGVDLTVRPSKMAIASARGDPLLSGLTVRSHAVTDVGTPPTADERERQRAERLEARTMRARPLSVDMVGANLPQQKTQAHLW